MENRAGSSVVEPAPTLEVPEGIATLLDAGDLQIELSTVQEATFYDQNREVIVEGNGCYCNPGQSCC